MPSIRLEELSAFGRASLKLDGDFSELTQLSAKIEKLDLESESDLDHAMKLLGEFSSQGELIAEDMQAFATALNEARARSEAAALSVEARAHLVQERQALRSQLQEKLVLLEEDIKAANAGLIGGPKKEIEALSEEEKRGIKAQFEQLERKLADIIDPAQKIKDEAAQLKFRRIERDAQSMLDTLLALRRKLQTILSA